MADRSRTTARRDAPASSVGADTPSPVAMIVSGSAALRAAAREPLLAMGIPFLEADRGAEGLCLADEHSPSLVLLDRRLPDLNSQELASMLEQRHPHADICLMGPDLRSVCAMRPPQHEVTPRILAALGETDEAVIPAVESFSPESVLVPAPPVPPLPGMVGRSEAIERVYRLGHMVAPRDTTVLLTGETGTGKELVARALHQLSPRAHRPFVVMNCAAIPEPLLEAELFGHTRGAFTGAVQARIGRIHAANGGTLFLDEVGELPLAMQSKLLRFLQDGEVQRLGSSDSLHVDVRVIAATNAELSERVVARQFRQDLYYRLLVFPIDLPPLRARGDDVLLLAEEFMRDHATPGASPKFLSARARHVLRSYPWPGNVRELRHAIERAVILSGDRVQVEPEYLMLSPALLRAQSEHFHETRS